jgi:hypothetical protein
MSNGEDAVVVTEENFGELLIDGLQEAEAVARGEQEPAQRNARPIRTIGTGLVRSASVVPQESRALS